MKLRNKKTGEIVEPFGITCISGRTFVQFDDGKGTFKFEAHSLAELNENYEDYEEPKDTNYWYIDDLGQIQFSSKILDEVEGHPNNLIARKLIGNYYLSEEEAERAVEKLKAWKRLKDKGFDIESWTADIGDNYYKTGDIVLNLNNVKDREWSVYKQIKEIKADLDICFGGEE